ncbi:MAG TPA: HupE/UreJ family protein [Gammaproteobacteria bacterium]|nr:HupE/UreJ family protein [Gammaproteobacteria bacterium]
MLLPLATCPSLHFGRRIVVACVGLLLCGVLAQRAFAHPAPFSYLDLRLDPDGARGTLVIHDFDAAHELGLAEPRTLLEPSVAQQRAGELMRLIDERLLISQDGEPATLQWRPGVQVLAEQQSLRFDFTLAPAGSAARVEIDTVLFPYDGTHQTFINLYEGARLERQAVLNASAHRFEHYVGTIQGRAAVVRRFVALGAEHILIGPDHLLFLLGLLLLGGSLWRLATIVTSFTLGHTITLSLAALDVVRLSPALVEPAIALSIVVVGVDNLLVGRRGGKAAASVDLRPWLAAAFGLIHGFGFAAVLREIGLPPGALGWSLAGFNVGVELGQLAAVLVAALLLAGVRRRDVVLAERVALGGSVAVVAVGLYWFAARIGLA